MARIRSYAAVERARRIIAANRGQFGLPPLFPDMCKEVRVKAVAATGMRYCTSCSRSKPADDFVLRRGRPPRCAACHAKAGIAPRGVVP
jgi:hypothetical protein